MISLKSLIVVAKARYTAKPEGKATLPLVLLRSLAGLFRSAIIPRLFLVVFRYSQPVLIRRAIRFVSRLQDISHTQTNGSWILLLACVTYVGLAVSCAHGVSRRHAQANFERSRRPGININLTCSVLPPGDRLIR